MTKFSGVVGYVESRRTSPGVSEDLATERKAFGEVLRNTRRLEENLDKLNKDMSVGNSISIVADAYSTLHFEKIRYVKWLGIRWTISDVVVEERRLILRLGAKYNGPIPS